MGIASTAVSVGKKALTAGKLFSPTGIATGLITLVVGEFLAHILEKAAGDPEAAVNQILEAGKQQATTKAMFAQTQPAEVQDTIAQGMKGVGKAAENKLTQMALMRQRAISITPDDTPVLAYISSKLGVNPEDLAKVSNPARMGDFSQLQSLPGMEQ